MKNQKWKKEKGLKKMKRWILYITTICLFLTFINCKKDDDDQDKTLLALILADLLYNPYEKITPSPGTITISGANYSNRAYNPACSGSSENKTFSFYRKK
ncbi:hypothetical protein LEP1GSC115_1257 [Leptospira interrogans serovar Australis str. 200703203]|nr:hypothetical protein LEP1GSC115_1257 [Leptospira interrogans serovar Australis str. 200703203]